ncbi:MAG: TonB-dependent receptor [Candidatus Thiodiazotropha sp. (ex Cardiolucina cf. quadrata)]|nr:TonB-dependent receptor [Candidatus Thiodiazotropha sp. (ex Cardiolucina cf. quadrata)]
MKLSINGRRLTAGILLITNLPLLAAAHLPTIVISASRTEQTSIETPAAITVIERDEIEQSGAHNLQQLLQSRSGIQINSLYGDGSQATIDMRGFGPTAGSNTLILVDGRRLNNSGDIAAPDLNAIDLRRVARIEIIQGSAGTLYGNQAVGGMVNIITRKPETFSANIAAAAGSYNGREGYAHLSNRLDNGLAYRFSAKRRISDNYRDNNETDRNDFNLRLDYQYANGGIFFEQQRVDDFQQLPGSLFADERSQNRRQSAAAYAGDFSETETDVSRIGLQQQLGPYWSFEGELTHRDNDREFQTGFRTFPGSLSTQDRTVKGFNPRFIGVYPMANGEARVTAGADLERTDYALRTSFGPTLLDQSVDAAYAQFTLPATDRIRVTGGFRHTSVDNAIESFAGIDQLDDSESVGALGISLQANDSLRLFVRVDENFRFATVDEHTNPVFGQPVGLENQTGISQEAGAEWRSDSFNAKLVIYRLDLDNEISFDTSGFSNINLDETQREGAILEGSWQIRSDLTLGGSLTYTDPRITAGPFDGNRIPLVAARTGRLSADWAPSQRWHLFAEGLFSSKRVLGGDFSNSFEQLPGYGLLNLGSQFTTGPWRIGLRIDNLLDKQYSNSGAVGFDAGFTRRAAIFPAPERNLWLTLNYRIE